MPIGERMTQPGGQFWQLQRQDEQGQEKSLGNLL